ncbi:hypothetical protein PG984_000318 [Apiospora sp. TS-2023a]
MSTDTNNNYRFGLFCPDWRTDPPTTSQQQETAAAAAKRTTVSGHGVLLGDGTISGGVGEIVTSSGGLQTADEISSESIIVNGKPLELTGGGLTTVIDGQDGSSVGGVTKNPDGSTSVDISGRDVTRGGEFWRRWRAVVNRSRRPDKDKKKKQKKQKKEPDVELEKLPLL